jgi:hypothetical protein
MTSGPGAGGKAEPDRKKEEAAAAALLLLVNRAKKKASAAAGESLDEAVAEATRQSSKSRLRKASVFGGILFASQTMSEKLAVAVQQGRLLARQGARRRLARELASLGIDAPESILGAVLVAEDLIRSKTAADAVVASWRASATVMAARAIRKEESVPGAVEETRQRLEKQAGLAARNEAADAYADERAETLRRAANDDPKFADEMASRRVVRVWVSALEERTCTPCARHHGDVTGLDDDFDGDEPGDMHAHCLCTWYLSTE